MLTHLHRKSCWLSEIITNYERPENDYFILVEKKAKKSRLFENFFSTRLHIVNDSVKGITYE